MTTGAVAVDAMEALRKQARRLKFADPAMEATFAAERVAAGLTRARAMLVIGIMAVGAIGLSDAVISSHLAPALIGDTLQLRFFGAAPVWLVMLISTWLPRPERRADWIGLLGTTVVCWIVALITWHQAQVYPRNSISSSLLVTVFPVLVVSALALPMGFRSVATMVALSVVGVVGMFALTVRPEQVYSLRVATDTLIPDQCGRGCAHLVS